MDRNKIVGERLKTLRGNESQAKVASDLSISPAALSAYELGERSPRDEVKIRMAEYYGKTVQEIFFTL